MPLIISLVSQCLQETEFLNEIIFTKIIQIERNHFSILEKLQTGRVRTRRNLVWCRDLGQISCDQTIHDSNEQSEDSFYNKTFNISPMSNFRQYWEETTIQLQEWDVRLFLDVERSWERRDNDVMGIGYWDMRCLVTRVQSDETCDNITRSTSHLMILSALLIYTWQ